MARNNASTCGVAIAVKFQRQLLVKGATRRNPGQMLFRPLPIDCHHYCRNVAFVCVLFRHKVLVHMKAIIMLQLSYSLL